MCPSFSKSKVFAVLIKIMGSKGFIFLGFLLAVVLVSSTSAVETSKDEKQADVTKETKVDEAKNEPLDGVKEPNQQYGGGGSCRYGCCRYGRYGCSYCCRDAKEAHAVETAANNEQVDGVKEPNQGGGRCRYGCCGGWGRFGCSHCCSGAKEAHAMETKANNEQGNEAAEAYQVEGQGGYGRGGWGGKGGGGAHP